MKRIAFLTAILSLSLPALQAASLCSTHDGTGTHSIALAKKKAKPAPAPDQTAGAKASKGAKDAKDAPKDAKDAKEEPKEAAAEDAPKPADAKPAEAEGQKTAVGKPMETCNRLRARMEEAEKELAAISKPSRQLQSRCKSTKSYVTSQLERMEAAATEIAQLQEKLDGATAHDYQFTIVPADQRDKYVQDGLAAHKAMLTDMKEKKKSRKIRGLDKFEIMRERFQGMPEYKEADAWYEQTLKDLERAWTKMKAAEEKKREKLQSAKRQKMEEDDDKGFEKLEKLLKEDGDDIAQVWYQPEPRNMRMLDNCLNKVRDALRRRETTKERQAEYIGCVPGLLTKFWDGMEKSRQALVSGNTEAASERLEEIDDVFNTIIRLPRNVMPEEYKEPLRKQREHLQREIRNRESEASRLARTLDSKLSSLERDRDNVEARIDSLMDDIAEEQTSDVGENTATIDESASDDAAEDGGKPAEGADEAGKDTDKGGDKGEEKPKADKPKASKDKGKSKGKGKKDK